MENKEMTCIVCPMGCRLMATKDGDSISVTGNTCPRGKQYAIQEMTTPMRVITSSVTILGGAHPLCPVKTLTAVPKSKIPACLSEIRSAAIPAPVKIGQIIIENLAGTGVALVATGNRK